MSLNKFRRPSLLNKLDKQEQAVIVQEVEEREVEAEEKKVVEKVKKLKK